MAKNHAGGSAHDVFMGLDEGLQLLCKDDADDVINEQKKCGNYQVSQDAFAKEFAKKMAKVKPLPTPKVDNRKGNRRGSSSSSKPAPPTVPEGAITQAEAKLLVPPGQPQQIMSSTANSEFQLHFQHPEISDGFMFLNRFKHMSKLMILNAKAA